MLWLAGKWLLAVILAVFVVGSLWVMALGFLDAWRRPEEQAGGEGEAWPRYPSRRS